jgi:hypothetical protein
LPQHGHRYWPRWGDHVQPDALEALILESQGSGCSVRYVDDPAWNDRASVVDPHDDRPAVLKIGDFNQRS